MYTNLLIDTNILRVLPSKTGLSPLLDHLQMLIKQGHVKLYCPDTLLEEWRKHRVIALKEISNSLRESEVKVQKLLAIKDPTADNEKRKLDELSTLLNSQVHLIDELLEGFSIHIPADSELQLKLLNRQRSGRAPFQKPEKNNFNDAEILFSVTDYLLTNKEQELYFVSNNTTEFAIGKDPWFLHPHIKDDIAGLNVHYATHIKPVLEVFVSLGLPVLPPASIAKIRKVIYIDKNKPVLDQVHHYLSKRFADFSIIPKEVFAAHYPFAKGDVFKHSHRPFTLTTDNKEVFTLLSSVKMQAGEIIEDNNNFIQTADDKRKITEVFKILNQNRIQKLSFEGKKELPLQYSGSATICNCYHCLLGKMKFDLILERLSGEKQDEKADAVRHKMILAYFHYKTGNFVIAADVLEELLNERSTRMDILYYIINFNLYHLGILLKNYYYEDPQLQNRGKKLHSINLDNVFSLVRNAADGPLLEWIHHRKFYRDGSLNMSAYTAEIRDLFYGQNGGFNPTTARLLEVYISTGDFLAKNSIIYDVFSEYNSLTSEYTESVFSSYGCSTRLGGKMNYFDDEVLKKLVFNGKAEQIQKFIGRYKLKKIAYKHSAQPCNSFVDAFYYLLDNYDVIMKLHEKTVYKENSYFADFLNEIVFNCLTISAVLELDMETIDTIAQKLLPLLSKEHFNRSFHLLKHLSWFFSKNQDIFTFETLRDYYLLSIHQGDFHDELWVELLADMIEKKGIAINLAEADFELAMSAFTGRCEACATEHTWHLLTDLYKLVNDDTQKQSIRDRVHDILSASFDSGKYYVATLGNFIAASPAMDEAYKDSIKEWLLKHPKPRLYHTTEFYTDMFVDHYLNFCFRYELDIPPELLGGLIEMGPYYQWITNLDGFDYTLFNPKWIFHHFTMYYKQRFRRSTVLKENLLNLIIREPDKELALRFVFIYSSDE